MKKIKAGIIGLGVGMYHLKNLLKEKYCDHITVYDFDKKKLNKISKENKKIHIAKNENEILYNKKINLIVIASFDNYHAKQVISSLKNNKNVFVEKPMCLFKKEYSDIKTLLKKKKKLKISSNLILRNSPQFAELKKQITNNYFGKIYNISGEYNYGRLKKITNGWRSKIPYYSVMLGGGIHIIDLAMYLKNKKPIKVFSTSNKIVTKNSSFKFPDFIKSIIKFEDESILSVTANFGCVIPHHHTFNVFGTKKTFIQNFENSKIFHSRKKNGVKVNNFYSTYEKTKILSSFVQNIINGKNPIVKNKDVMDCMAVCIAAEESLNKNKWIRIKY